MRYSKEREEARGKERQATTFDVAKITQIDELATRKEIFNFCGYVFIINHSVYDLLVLNFRLKCLDFCFFF